MATATITEAATAVVMKAIRRHVRRRCVRTRISASWYRRRRRIARQPRLNFREEFRRGDTDGIISPIGASRGCHCSTAAAKAGSRESRAGHLSALDNVECPQHIFRCKHVQFVAFVHGSRQLLIKMRQAPSQPGFYGGGTRLETLRQSFPALPAIIGKENRLPLFGFKTAQALQKPLEFFRSFLLVHRMFERCRKFRHVRNIFQHERLLAAQIIERAITRAGGHPRNWRGAGGVKGVRMFPNSQINLMRYE